MAHLSWHLVFDKITLPDDWIEIVLPADCLTLELTADVDWFWCSDKTNGASRKIGAFTREVVVSTTRLMPAGQKICWVKGNVVGVLYRKFTS